MIVLSWAGIGVISVFWAFALVGMGVISGRLQEDSIFVALYVSLLICEVIFIGVVGLKSWPIAAMMAVVTAIVVAIRLTIGPYIK